MPFYVLMPWVAASGRGPAAQQGQVAHGPADPQWAEQAAREMQGLETQYNQPQPPDGGAASGDQP